MWRGRVAVPAFAIGEWYGLLLNGAICTITFTSAIEQTTAFHLYGWSSRTSVCVCVSVQTETKQNGFVEAALKFFGVFLFLTSIWCNYEQKHVPVYLPLNTQFSLMEEYSFFIFTTTQRNESPKSQTQLQFNSMQHAPVWEPDISPAIEQIPVFYGTPVFIAVFTTASPLIVTRYIQSTHSNQISWRSILILSFHLRFSSKWSLSFTPVCISLFPLHVVHAPAISWYLISWK
jgi:hypothetical protein